MGFLLEQKGLLQWRLLFILLACLNARFTLLIHGNDEIHGLAADVAVLRIFLEPNGTIDHDFHALTAVGADDLDGFQQTH